MKRYIITRYRDAGGSITEYDEEETEYEVDDFLDHDDLLSPISRPKEEHKVEDFLDLEHKVEDFLDPDETELEDNISPARSIVVVTRRISPKINSSSKKNKKKSPSNKKRKSKGAYTGGVRPKTKKQKLAEEAAFEEYLNQPLSKKFVW